MNEEYSIVDALVELKPGAEWTIDGRDYDRLVWLDKSQTKPTLDELTTKLSAMNAAEPMRRLRVQRDKLLTECDWIVTMNKELGTNIPAAWKTYRQSLRDLPSTQTPVLDDNNMVGISSVTWPTKPS